MNATHQEENTDEQDRNEMRLDVFSFYDQSQLDHPITLFDELYHLGKAINNKKEGAEGMSLVGLQIFIFNETFCF